MPRITHNHSAVAANHSLYQNELLNETHTTLREIASNTKNINLNVDTVDVSVDALEVLQAQTNTTLAAMLIDTDAIDSSCNTIEAQSVLTASRLNNIQNKIAANVDGTGDTLGQINSNILAKNGEIESSLNSLISANHDDLVALEATADLILAKNTEIESTANSILAKNTELEAELGLIKQAVELIDNAVDGDYLNVNQNIAGTDVSSNSGNKDAQTQRFCLATDDVPTGLTHSILNAINGSVGTGNATLVNIKTALELLDNALDGNYLNVNQNIAGTDVSSNSGNKDAQTQRVCIATDDIPFDTLNTHLFEIEDAVETLQACVDSNKVKVQFEAGDLNIGNVDVASSALPSGASTESSLTAMSAKLPASLGPKGNGASISTCRNSTAGEYDMSGRTTIATAGTSTKLLCDAQGHLQVDVLTGGSTDVSALSTHAKQDIIIGHVDGIEGLLGTTNSGISSIDSGITDIDGLITDGNALLTAIDSDTNNIKTAVETLAGAVDANGAAAIGVRSDVYFQGVASETNSGNKNDNCQRVVLATDDIPLATANAKLVEIETTANSILAKNTEIETTADGILAKNTEMETSLNSILSKNGEIESSMNSLISANHTDLVALEASLTEIAPRQAVSAVYTAATLADDGISTTIDTDDFSFMTICASQNSANLPLEIQYSINDSNWFKVRSKLLTFAAYEGGSWADIVLEHPMRYVRFVNTSGSSITSLHLSYQLSN